MTTLCYTFCFTEESINPMKMFVKWFQSILNNEVSDCENPSDQEELPSKQSTSDINNTNTHYNYYSSDAIHQSHINTISLDCTTMTKKPQGKVHFCDELVTSVFNIEKCLPQEKDHLYYSPKELNQFYLNYLLALKQKAVKSTNRSTILDALLVILPTLIMCACLTTIVQRILPIIYNSR